MTNDENIETRHVGEQRRQKSSFELSHSFVIRSRFAGSFVICVLALTFAFAFSACNSSKKLTKANVAEVAEGMSKKQVESILGPPTTVDTKDVQLKRTVYIYAQGKESVTVVFKDDKVQSTTSTLSE
jgi:outer membrane protein assembly factor BamE (lipoprotein component of BamABCDE complex)